MDHPLPVPPVQVSGLRNHLLPRKNALVKRLCIGRLIHADETKISVEGKDGFVWVFANMEEVAYVYSETRQGSTPQSLLKDFTGVLVSDFYAAYDGIPCPQQKCLIHLIRDLNDAVLKYPDR